MKRDIDQIYMWQNDTIMPCTQNWCYKTHFTFVIIVFLFVYIVKIL